MGQAEWSDLAKLSRHNEAITLYLELLIGSSIRH